MTDAIATIDFEASALRGYPIEVGVARWDRGADVIGVWSTLVRPIPNWRDDPDRWWDPAAEAVHGIKPSDLDRGLRPRAAMAVVNAIVAGPVAYCDGGPFDAQFLGRLSDAAGFGPSFRLGGLSALAGAAGLDGAGRARAAALLAEGEASVAHRAGPDALRILLAVAAATGCAPTIVALEP